MAGKSAFSAAAKAGMIRALFENSHDLMHVVSDRGLYKMINPAWTRVLGWDEADVIGKPAVEFTHPDERDGLIDRFRAMGATDVSERYARLRGKDGAYRWFAARTQKMPNGEYVGTLRDATEERARATELEETRRSRRLLSESAGIGAWTFEPLDNRIEWSTDLLNLSGYRPEDIASPDQFHALIHPADLKRTIKAMAHGVRTGEGATLEHRLKVGGRWTSWRATFRTEPRPGGIFAIKGISENITELARARDAARREGLKMKKARAEAQANAQRLAVALEAAESGAYEIDHVAKTFWASPEFVKLTGQDNASYDEAIQLRFPGFHPDDLGHVRESFRVLHTGDGRSGHFDARIVRPDGETRWVRVSHHLKVGKGGRWLKAVGLIQDIDARKRQEIALVEAQQAAEAASEAKAAFLANMSHEIRTPMNGVMGVLHLLKTEALSAEGRGMLEEALTCGEMLAELLNDVIDFSKIEAGRLELSNQPLDPGELAQGVARLLHPQAHAKGLALKVEADPGVGWVSADPLRLRQALFNLVGNAVKFTLEGAVTLRCRRGDAPGRLRFEVQDTGVGVPLDVQPRIFQRFDQGDASTTRRFGGSGLGLAITRKLAEMMGGDVGFTSTEGVGSVFWIEVAAEPAIAPDAVAEVGGDVLGGLRILVVEDNATNRVIATKLLENLGAEVETAADGLLGVEAARRATYDLILMDVQMPGIDGLEASRRIRRLPGESAHTPIVALTANVLAHQRDAYLQAGMNGVVGKPISPAALVTEIARLCVGDPCGDEAAA